MRPTQVVEALKLYILAKQPVMLHGSPGVGKSDTVRQVSEWYDGGLIDIRLSQMDPVDLRGVPTTQSGMTRWSPPHFWPSKDAVKKGLCPEKGVIFWDEINAAGQSCMAAAYQAILDHQIGDIEFAPGWVHIAAGNRTSDRAIVNQMSTALRNRFAHIEYEVEPDDWYQWALTHAVHPSVLGFLRFRPASLNDFDTTDKKHMQMLKDAKAFATPRSWSFVSKLVKVSEQAGAPIDKKHIELIAGIVGEGHATEYMAFLNHYQNLPNFDELLKNPEKAKVPEDMSVLYALATGLAVKADPQNMDAVVTYALRIPAEFQVLLMKDCITRNNKLSDSKAFSKWAMKNTKVML